MDKQELIEEDILLDLQDAIKWMFGDYGGVTKPRIARVRELLDQLERTVE